MPGELTKWITFGTGVGIEIFGAPGMESLRVVAVSARPSGGRVVGQLLIEDFPHQPAGVWGTEYAAFVRKFGLRHTGAVVLLPRQDMIVRHLALPGVSNKDLEAAVQFQMDGLHPYAEDDVLSSWARLPGSAIVLVAVARRTLVERYTGLFAEAGVTIRGFTCSAAAIHSALRFFGARPPAEILAWERSGDRVEYYGESPARPVFSASFNSADAEMSHAAAQASAELRLEPGFASRPLEELLPAPSLAYAAALASACPRLSLPLNLLPAAQRHTTSPLRLVPSAVLGLGVLLLAGALFALPGYENRRYLRSLNAEIAKVSPRAARVSAIDKQIETARRRTQMLDEFRHRAKTDMDVLNEMTRILPPPTWVTLIEVNRNQVMVAGETDQAAPLLKTIDASPLFEASEFNGAPTRVAAGENFRIRANREAGK